MIFLVFFPITVMIMMMTMIIFCACFTSNFFVESLNILWVIFLCDFLCLLLHTFIMLRWLCIYGEYVRNWDMISKCDEKKEENWSVRFISFACQFLVKGFSCRGMVDGFKTELSNFMLYKTTKKKSHVKFIRDCLSSWYL